MRMTMGSSVASSLQPARRRRSEAERGRVRMMVGLG
jgi:hypothetical protein